MWCMGRAVFVAGGAWDDDGDDGVLRGMGRGEWWSWLWGLGGEAGDRAVEYQLLRSTRILEPEGTYLPYGTSLKGDTDDFTTVIPHDFLSLIQEQLPKHGVPSLLEAQRTLPFDLSAVLPNQ